MLSKSQPGSLLLRSGGFAVDPVARRRPIAAIAAPSPAPPPNRKLEIGIGAGGQPAARCAGGARASRARIVRIRSTRTGSLLLPAGGFAVDPVARRRPIAAIAAPSPAPPPNRKLANRNRRWRPAGGSMRRRRARLARAYSERFRSTRSNYPAAAIVPLQLILVNHPSLSNHLIRYSF